MLRKTPKGLYNRGRAKIVRSPAELTTEYELCNFHKSTGSIPVANHAMVTLWLDPIFAGLTSLEMRIEYADEADAPNGYWSDITSEVGTKIIKTVAGPSFTEEMVGKRWSLFFSTTLTAQFGDYIIEEVVDANTARLDRDPTNGVDDIANGIGAMDGGFQEMSFSESGASVAVDPYELQMVAAEFAAQAPEDGYIFTIPTAGAPHMRLFVKGTGAVAGSNLVVAYTLCPDGGV